MQKHTNAMKLSQKSTFKKIAFFGFLILATGRFGLLAQPTNSTATANVSEADQAWKELQKANQPPAPPAEWEKKKPTRDEIIKFQLPFVNIAVDKSKDFYTRFPQDSRADKAKKMEVDLLNVAVQ